ncbi:GNAT family N-acetyltransferase [Candidatus Micrarchaeota archaeon]|nr:GNAT family N-acetyltransferase [Candidatus Micrarchaeota archaeon]
MPMKRPLKPLGKKPVFTVHELDFNDPRVVGQAAEVLFKAYEKKPDFSAVPANWSPNAALERINLHWLNAVNLQQGKAFVAKDNTGKIVGAAIGHLDKIGGGNTIYWLGGVAVHPSFQRRGVSTLLTQARLGAARELGCKTIMTKVHKKNTARLGQFKKEGFARFQTVDENFYLFRKELESP